MDNTNQQFTIDPVTGVQTPVVDQELIKQQQANAIANQNLSNQGAIIAAQKEQQKVYEAQIAELLATNKSLISQQNQNNFEVNPQSNVKLYTPDTELAKQVEEIKQYMASAMQQQKIANFQPIKDEMLRNNIAEGQHEHFLEQVKKEHGIDLKSNPNVNTLRMVLNSVVQQTMPQTVPTGHGHTVLQVTAAELQQQQQAAAFKQQQIQNSVDKSINDYLISKGLRKRQF